MPALCFIYLRACSIHKRPALSRAVYHLALDVFYRFHPAPFINLCFLELFLNLPALRVCLDAVSGGMLNHLFLILLSFKEVPPG